MNIRNIHGAIWYREDSEDDNVRNHHISLLDFICEYLKNRVCLYESEIETEAENERNRADYIFKAHNNNNNNSNNNNNKQIQLLLYIL